MAIHSPDSVFLVDLILFTLYLYQVAGSNFTQLHGSIKRQQPNSNKHIFIAVWLLLDSADCRLFAVH